MIGFFIKKSFFDGWDNLFGIVLCNFVHIGLLVLFFLLPGAAGAARPVLLVLAAVGAVLMSIWQAACTFAMTEVSDYHGVSFKATVKALKKAWKPGLWMGLLSVALLYSVALGIPFYFAQKNLLGILAGVMLFWFSLAVLFASQYYLALVARLGGGFRKNIKKAFILVFDNVGLTLVLLIYNVVCAAISIFDFFMVPGFAGIALNEADALKLLLKKYDWLEANPGEDRKHIPWDSILEEEKELVGKRSFKGMIFPWKDDK